VINGPAIRPLAKVDGVVEQQRGLQEAN